MPERLGRADSPPWQRAQGGVAAPINKMPRSLLSGRRRGGWFQPPLIGCSTNHPGRAFKGRGPFSSWRVHPSLAKEGCSIRLPLSGLMDFSLDALEYYRLKDLL